MHGHLNVKVVSWEFKHFLKQVKNARAWDTFKCYHTTVAVFKQKCRSWKSNSVWASQKFFAFTGTIFSLPKSQETKSK